MYKVTNKLGCRVKLGDIYFEPSETKKLDFAPTSDKFIVEKIEKIEKRIKSKEVKQDGC